MAVGLRCEPSKGEYEVRRIGPKGGTIDVGLHTIEIPAGALAEEMDIGASVKPGASVELELAPHRLQFRQPVEITFDYGECVVADEDALDVVYVGTGWRILRDDAEHRQAGRPPRLRADRPLQRLHGVHRAPRAALLPSATPTLPTTVVGTVGDTTVHRFIYQPAVALTARIAAHEVRFPAGAVCDPRPSSYGAGTWDAPCTPLATGLTFTVPTWSDADGHPRIRLSPDVRFVPSRTVTLALSDKAALDKRFPTVGCPTAAASCVDEAAADPSVASQRDPETFYLYGRIKPFSGYDVVVARSGDGTTLDGSRAHRGHARTTCRERGRPARGGRSEDRTSAPCASVPVRDARRRARAHEPTRGAWRIRCAHTVLGRAARALERATWRARARWYVTCASRNQSRRIERRDAWGGGPAA